MLFMHNNRYLPLTRLLALLQWTIQPAPIVHREIFEIFQKYFAKYFMKYFTPKNFMKFCISTCDRPQCIMHCVRPFVHSGLVRERNKMVEKFRVRQRVCSHHMSPVLQFTEQRSKVMWVKVSMNRIYSVSQKKIPLRFSGIFPKRLGIFCPSFTRLLYVPIYARLQIFLFNYLQLWRSYAILSATTQFTSYVQNVHHRPKRVLAFSEIFSQTVGNF